MFACGMVNGFDDFCRCPVLVVPNNPDGSIKAKLRSCRVEPQ